MDTANFGKDGEAVVAQGCEVLTCDLDDDLTIDLRDRFEHVVANRLREGDRDARDGLEVLIDFCQYLFFGQAPSPFFLIMQVDQRLDLAGNLGVGTVFGAPQFADNALDLRGFSHLRPDTASLQLGFADRDTGLQGDVEPDAAFIEFGQEFGAQACCYPHGHSQPDRGQRENDAPMAK